MTRLSNILIFVFLTFYFVSAENPSVIIVGAGPAGIAAATKLFENSITNITILEAENRIGGRVYSVEFGDGFVDMGAEYCHGEEGNIVYQKVKDLNVLEHTHPYAIENMIIYSSQGSKIPANVSKDLLEIALNYEEETNKESDERKSIGEVLYETYNKTILKKYINNEKNFKFAMDGVKLIENGVLTHEGAFNWYQPAAKQHYEDCPGDNHLTWKIGGYNTIINVLLKKFPNPEEKLPIDDKILLNKKVTKIIWNQDQAQVRLSDDSILQADYVIFTPSIGVLKNQKNTLFEPKLPQEKITAIEAIGFSGVMKVFLHFPEKWWTNETFILLWNSEDLEKAKQEFTEGPKKNGLPWVVYIANIVKVANNKNVLAAWITSDLLPEIEQIPEDILLKGCNYVIKKFLGKDYNVVEADKLVRSQWITNPNFSGTFCYENAGYPFNVSYQEKLSKPLKNSAGTSTLLFAGTATHPTKYGTVHGAIETGYREADRIIKNKKKVQQT